MMGDMSNPVIRAVEAIGSQTKLAEAVKVRPQAVQQWVRAGRVPVPRVMEVARAVDFKVTPHELAPHLYPNPQDGLPREAA